MILLYTVFSLIIIYNLDVKSDYRLVTYILSSKYGAKKI